MSSAQPTVSFHHLEAIGVGTVDRYRGRRTAEQKREEEEEDDDDDDESGRVETGEEARKRKKTREGHDG